MTTCDATSLHCRYSRTTCRLMTLTFHRLSPSTLAPMTGRRETRRYPRVLPRIPGATSLLPACFPSLSDCLRFPCSHLILGVHSPHPKSTSKRQGMAGHISHPPRPRTGLIMVNQSAAILPIPSPNITPRLGFPPSPHPLITGDTDLISTSHSPLIHSSIYLFTFLHAFPWTCVVVFLFLGFVKVPSFHLESQNVLLPLLLSPSCSPVNTLGTNCMYVMDWSWTRLPS